MWYEHLAWYLWTDEQSPLNKAKQQQHKNTPVLNFSITKLLCNLLRVRPPLPHINMYYASPDHPFKHPSFAPFRLTCSDSNEIFKLITYANISCVPQQTKLLNLHPPAKHLLQQ